MLIVVVNILGLLVGLAYLTIHGPALLNYALSRRAGNWLAATAGGNSRKPTPRAIESRPVSTTHQAATYSKRRRPASENSVEPLPAKTISGTVPAPKAAIVAMPLKRSLVLAAKAT